MVNRRCFLLLPFRNAHSAFPLDCTIWIYVRNISTELMCIFEHTCPGLPLLVQGLLVSTCLVPAWHPNPTVGPVLLSWGHQDIPIRYPNPTVILSQRHQDIPRMSYTSLCSTLIPLSIPSCPIISGTSGHPKTVLYIPARHPSPTVHPVLSSLDIPRLSYTSPCGTLIPLFVLSYSPWGMSQHDAHCHAASCKLIDRIIKFYIKLINYFFNLVVY